MPIESINPATGNTLKTFEPTSERDLEARLQRAQDTFRSYRRTPFAERAAILMRAADILEHERERWGRLMTSEMGKTLQSAIDEAAKCANACRYYAEHGERFLADEPIASDADRSFVRYQPLGPVLAIMPWNFPFWQVFRFAAPALMAGNVGLLKHASNVPQCALAIEEIWRRAGAPDGAFQTLLIGSDRIEQLIADRRIAAVTLTGSEGAGRSVGGAAGRAIKPSVLELGGSDPFIVMPSADLDRAAETAVKARVINNGQSCIAAKRFIVHEQIADAWERRFVERMRQLKVGDPMDRSTDVGPLATPSILDDLDTQVRESVRAGARVLIGGKRVDGPGTFYEPTALTDIPPDAPVFHEEVFGPVALLFRVPSLDAAIELANATSFGLGSSAWTNDDNERERLIDEIEAGQVFINAMVASDPRLPFGGVKHSGYGRELSHHGIRAFVNAKTVSITLGSGGGSSTE